MAGASVTGTRRAGAIAAAALLCAAALLGPAGGAPASSALVGYETGLYEGTTDQGERVTFRAREWRVRGFDAVLFADCKNGERQRIAIEHGRALIEDDRFDLKLTGATDLVVRISGKLRDQAAAGRIDATVRPPGTACAGTVRWQAARAKDLN
jgi:hypothetical protein